MQNLKSIPKQKGAAIILMAFIIGLGAIAYLLHALDPQRLKLEQDKKTMQTLNEAKQALIAWSVSHATHPGQMPFPDRGTGGGYDGKSDCNPPNNNPLLYSFLIGQLPIYGQTAPCVNPRTGIGGDFEDAQGDRLWYAVSRNLTHKYETDPLNTNPVEPIINPSVIDNPMYAWLKVIDRNGVLISDRVAAVIIAPGDPVGGQNRTAIAPASEFLDTFKIGANTYSNADYTKPDEDFIVGDDSRNVSSADTTFVQPYSFNDKLVYITIDELVAALNNRAASEASRYLNQYKTKTLQFPYAAPLGSTLNNHISAGTSQQGFVPVDGTDLCTCSPISVNPTQSCTCRFQAIAQVTMTRGSGSWSTSAGACSVSLTNNKNCNCTGAGQCTRGVRYFTCDSFGVCQHNLAGSNNFTYTVPNYAKISQPIGGGCASPAGKQITCNDADQFNIGLDLPTWFDENSWADFLYYEWTPTSNLQVGGKIGVSALLIATGRVIVNSPFAIKGSQQIRPSNMINDYLDSVENTNGDVKFDATNQQKSNNYNDQIYVVAP